MVIDPSASGIDPRFPDVPVAAIVASSLTLEEVAHWLEETDPD